MKDAGHGAKALLPRADPWLLAIRAANRVLEQEDERASLEIYKARQELYGALRAGNAEMALAWLGALEAAVCAVPGWFVGREGMVRAVDGLKGVIQAQKT